MKIKVPSIGSVIALLLLAGLTTTTYGQQFSAWSTPENLGSPINTSEGAEGAPFMSKDGLSLYFTRLEDGTDINSPQDVWVAKRTSPSDDWGEPEKLGPAINTPATEGMPFVTVDGHWMYFNSNRAGGFGRQDIYVSRRHNKREDFPTDPSGGWKEPVNLGAGVNTRFGEQAPFVFEDEVTGVTTLYFNSNRSGNNDIYISTLQPDGTFGPAVPVTELNTPAIEQYPTLSRDGLEMYFISDRLGSTLYYDGNPSPDIWVSTRASTSAPWGTPENLDVVSARLGGPAINSPFHEGKATLSFDGTTLFIYSGEREGNLSDWFDIWMTTRSKLNED